MAVQKLWRDSASLLLVSKATIQPVKGAVTPILRANKYKKENISPSNFNLLMLKRSSKSSFMPNAYIFPGGVIDNADSDMQWLDIFNKLGKYSDLDSLIIKNRNLSDSPIFTKTEADGIPREISLRISAIRETFEECGLLLCSNENSQSHWSSLLPLNESELKQWQYRVHKNPSEFINLCNEFHCYPNVWSLYEWKNWLTPKVLMLDGNKRSLRFDTIFFLAALDHTPESTKQDNKEVTQFLWNDPMNCLKLYKEKKILLYPPQIYELCGLVGYDADELVTFAKERNSMGVQRIYPVGITCSDGEINVFPGDSEYPTNPDYVGDEEPLKSSKTVDEHRESSAVVHRLEMFGQLGTMKFKNLPSICGHRTPIPFDEIKLLWK